MNIIIIEDEERLAKQLEKILLEIDSEINILSIIASVETAISLIPSFTNIDLMLVDIYLSDGISFEIFKKIDLQVAVVFCTAYDQYALQAFELDSVDYLLKPIKKEELSRAINKYKRLFSDKSQKSKNLDFGKQMTELLAKLSPQSNYQRNFLLPQGERLIPISIEEISYFQAEYGVVKCITQDGCFFPMDQSLDALTESLDPTIFFRVSRQYLVKREAIVDAEHYFNGRLHLNISPKTKDKIIISKAKVKDFKQWMVQP